MATLTIVKRNGQLAETLWHYRKSVYNHIVENNAIDQNECYDVYVDLALNYDRLAVDLFCIN